MNQILYDKAVVLAIEAETFASGIRPVDRDLAILTIHPTRGKCSKKLVPTPRRLP